MLVKYTKCLQINTIRKYKWSDNHSKWQKYYWKCIFRHSVIEDDRLQLLSWVGTIARSIEICHNILSDDRIEEVFSIQTLFLNLLWQNLSDLQLTQPLGSFCTQTLYRSSKKALTEIRSDWIVEMIFRQISIINLHFFSTTIFYWLFATLKLVSRLAHLYRVYRRLKSYSLCQVSFSASKISLQLLKWEFVVFSSKLNSNRKLH